MGTVDTDARPEVQRLFSALKSALPELERCLAHVSNHWGYEDIVSRFYHQSFKLYPVAQAATRDIRDALQALLPDRPLNEWFTQIVEEGTRSDWEPAHNERWPLETRPIVEAFLHARFFLEMAVQYGRRLDAPPAILPSGWAAFLYLYNLR